MTWFVFVLAVVGTILNIRKHWSCFAIWLTTNVFWLAHNYQLGERAQAAQYAVLALTCVWGLWTWLPSKWFVQVNTPTGAFSFGPYRSYHWARFISFIYVEPMHSHSEVVERVN